MKPFVVLVAALLAFQAQAPLQSSPAPAASAAAPAPAASVQIRPHHLVYRFGYNTRVADSGAGTGTTTIDILGQASDGGVMIRGQDYVWNTTQPRQANTCEVYSNGSVECAKAPYTLSPIQATLFPLLARGYFHALQTSQTAAFSHTLQVTCTFAPVLTGEGFAGQVYTWKGSYNLTGKGVVQNSAPPLLLVAQQGTFRQQGGRYIKIEERANIIYDPQGDIPVYVSDLRTYFPQFSVYNSNSVEVELKSAAMAAQP
jgi:hypothetical protein